MTLIAGILAVLLAVLVGGLRYEAARLARALQSERDRGWRDEATGLATREVFLERTLIECKRAERRGTHVAANLLTLQDPRDLPAVARELEVAIVYPAQAFRVGPATLAWLHPHGGGAPEPEQLLQHLPARAADTWAASYPSAQLAAAGDMLALCSAAVRGQDAPA